MPIASWRLPGTSFEWRLPGTSLLHVMKHVGVERANQEPGAHADPSKDGPPGKDKTTGVQAGAHTGPSGGHGRSRETRTLRPEMLRATEIQAGAHTGPSGDWRKSATSTSFERRLPGTSSVHIMKHVGVQRANQEPGAHADPSKDGPLGNDKTTGVQAGAHMEPSGGHGDKDTEAGNATGHGDPSRSPYRSK